MNYVTNYYPKGKTVKNNPVLFIDEKLDELRECLHSLNCPMGLSEESHNEQIWIAHEAIDAIQKALKKVCPKDR